MKLLDRLVCLVLDHEWKGAGEGLPESASPEKYDVCERCGEDSRETWRIIDDQDCRAEREVLVRIKVRR